MTTTARPPAEQPRGAGGNTARGAQRRAEIIDAAVRVIAESGLDGLSMRSVAAEAGMPLGALSYYFTGKADLVVQSFRRLSEAEIDRVVQQAAELAPTMTPEAMADLLADMTVDGLDRSRGTIVARHELMVEASRDDALAPLFEAWYVAMVPALGRLFRAVGSTEPEVDARLVLATLAGLEVDHIYRPLQHSDRESIRAVLRRLFAVLAAERG